jgi:hypothetical protein
MENTHSPDNPTEAVVQFVPQVWRGPTGDQRAVTADKRDQVEFTVPIEDATDENGKLLPTDSYKSDHLRAHENAPGWCSEWDNPFYITIDSTR